MNSSNPWETASEGGTSEGSCFFFGEQLAVHQSRRGSRRSGCHRIVSGLLYGFFRPCHYAWEYKGESFCSGCSEGLRPPQTWKDVLPHCVRGG